MGKIAVVTGASKGIGRACALRLAKDGMTVVVNYSHSDAEAAKTVEEIKAAGGVSTMEDLEGFLALGCDRIGTSRAVGLCKGQQTSGY